MARQLRAEHGFNKADSLALAGLITNPDTRCSICGVPGHVLARYTGKMPARRLGARGLHVDHIIPGGPSTMENSRILCCMCNWRRGAARLTDQEVLWATRKWWQKRRVQRLLWWLNLTPGVGGRLYRSPAMEKQAASFKAMRKS